VRAWYDLGNCLVQQGAGQAAVLEEALECYRRCLVHPHTPVDLRTDAAHNLEVAKQLWLKARTSGKDSSPKTDRQEDQNPSMKKETKHGLSPSDKKGQAGKQGDPGFDPKGNGQDAGDAAKKMVGQGQLFSLPDQDELVSLPPDAAADFLDRAMRRMLDERRAWNRPAPALLERVKDW
jgi:hypothetical protein